MQGRPPGGPAVIQRSRDAAGDAPRPSCHRLKTPDRPARLAPRLHCGLPAWGNSLAGPASLDRTGGQWPGRGPGASGYPQRLGSTARSVPPSAATSSSRKRSRMPNSPRIRAVSSTYSLLGPDSPCPPRTSRTCRIGRQCQRHRHHWPRRTGQYRAYSCCRRHRAGHCPSRPDWRVQHHPRSAASRWRSAASHCHRCGRQHIHSQLGHRTGYRRRRYHATRSTNRPGDRRGR